MITMMDDSKWYQESRKQVLIPSMLSRRKVSPSTRSIMIMDSLFTCHAHVSPATLALPWRSAEARRNITAKNMHDRDDMRLENQYASQKD